MRREGLEGVTRRKFCRTTRRDESARPAPDLLERDFSAPAPDQRWVADITYVPTWAGFLFLAIVLDVCTRKVVGWSMSATQNTELVVRALKMAVARQRPTGVVVHHSDQGCQYASYDFARACRAAGVDRSMGSVGDCYDNAMAESFFATLECELIDRSVFENRNQARMAIFDYIEALLQHLAEALFDRQRRTCPLRGRTAGEARSCRMTSGEQSARWLGPAPCFQSLSGHHSGSDFGPARRQRHHLASSRRAQPVSAAPRKPVSAKLRSLQSLGLLLP